MTKDGTSARLPRLHSRLILLAAASILPVFVLSLVLGYFLIQHNLEVFRRAALGRNHTFLTALDAQIQGYIGTLRALAASSSLEADDLRKFYAELQRVLATQPDWRNILLLDPSGQQLVNIRLPFGSDLPRETDAHLDSFLAVVGSRQLTVGQLGVGPISTEPGIAVRLPILRSGSVRYVLQFILKPEALARLLASQRYPSSWTIGVVDANLRFITRQPFRPAGALPSADFRAALLRGRDTWYRGSTLEGRDTYTALNTSELTRWTVGVAVPATEIYGAVSGATAALLAGVLVSLVLAILLARRAARRLTTPIAELASAARRLDQPSSIEILQRMGKESQLLEVVEVATALAEAQESLLERERLRQREQEALREADRAKNEFLAMLGHELRNPLSAIVASAHVLRLSGPGMRASSQAHEVIERQARQMARLVEDLLDVSRLATGKLTLQHDRMDLGAVVERAFDTWAASRSERQQRASCATESAWVSGDRGRLEQILVNLLENAEKFSAERGGPIRVRVFVSNGNAVLEVKDEGQGIAAADLPRVFDLFAQGLQTLDRPQGGLGLGLTLAKRFAEMHGGSIAVVSSGIDQGATFTVSLPLADKSTFTEVAAVQDQPLRRRRVVIVEDNDDGRLMLETALALEGHEVRSVSTGLQAVDCLLTWYPDVALVDIGLPDIDGYEVARRVRSAAPDHPPKLIAVSGFGRQEDLNRAYEAGFDLHLTKPVALSSFRMSSGL